MISLLIETDNPRLAEDLIANNSDQFQLRLEKQSMRQGAFETKFLFEFLLEVSSGVTAELIARYINGKLDSRADKLRVNGVSVSSEADCRKALTGSDRP